MALGSTAGLVLAGLMFAFIGASNFRHANRNADRQEKNRLGRWFLRLNGRDAWVSSQRRWAVASIGFGVVLLVAAVYDRLTR